MSGGINPRAGFFLASVGLTPDRQGWATLKLRKHAGTWDYMAFIGRVSRAADSAGVASHQRVAFDRVCQQVAIEETLRAFPA